jgi:chromosome partitioning protein
MSGIKRKAAPKPQQKCRIIVLSSPKGGTGKTTFAQNLLPLLARDGLKVLGVDLDPQETLTKWFAVRQQTAYRRKRSPLPPFDVISLHLRRWRQALEHAQRGGYDAVIFDLPPSVLDIIDEVDPLCRVADLVVVTTAATFNDLSSTLPWIESLARKKFKFAACLNRVNRREVAFEVARAGLNKLGPMCPVEVRALSDTHAYAMEGLAAVDKPKSKAAADFTGVWHYLRRELGMEAH